MSTVLWILFWGALAVVALQNFISPRPQGAGGVEQTCEGVYWPTINACIPQFKTQ